MEGDFVIVVFCQTEYHYNGRGKSCCEQGRHSRSYEDFWRLVEVSGYPIIPLSDVDLEQKVVYIVAPPNGELDGILADARSKAQGNIQARFVAWDLEMPHEENKDTHSRKENLAPLVDEIWVSDRGHYRTLRWAGVRNVRFVPVGSDPRFRPGLLESLPMAYDVIALSCGSRRRRAVLDPILRHKEVRAAPNGWDESRHRALLSSKLMLNVHQFPVRHLEPLRFALAAAYCIPIISEIIDDPYPLIPGEHYVQVTEKAILDRVLETVRQPDTPKNWLPSDMAAKCHRRLCEEFRFEKNVTKAVGEMLECLTSSSLPHPSPIDPSSSPKP